ncbi:FHA domain-containing protein FhaB/FipA [Brachybacterium fresconis]|uniref:PSer/pThr/pTyr-binding forkhead associated (FHA) protein n=1 Tax=Brachybacterium fresconis TaxID=173363 RepID=A0ABS4YKA9_9MICO|nr:FHA domain-containing protein [Brachybacterium fresconis]MBP2408920.1 pSer/pThr/pTyr-binding forkhead associated (FHA) protein [Brachybacterium fresconis]
MSELTLVALRLGFVLALWVFVIVVVLVLRNDLFGTTVVNRSSKDPRRDRRPASGPVGGAAGSPGTDPAALRTDPEVTATAMVVTAGPLRGTSLTLGSTPILIGRAPECTLVLDDDYASNRHARVFQREGEWIVEDLGSTNGTLVSGRRIEGAVPFRPGAQVRIGRTEIELRRGPR